MKSKIRRFLEDWKAYRQGGHEAGKQEVPGKRKILVVKRSRMMDEDRWQKLKVWKLADELAFQVYNATRQFPKEEIYGITSQVRRSALSIPTNIVEGYSRKGDKELSHFINISLASLAETKYLLYFSNRLGYFRNNTYDELKAGYETLGKLLWKFYEAVKAK
jgi:four helix bundle protein